MLPSILVCKKISTYDYIVLQREKEEEEKTAKEAKKHQSLTKHQTVGYFCPYFLELKTKLPVCYDVHVPVIV